MLDEVGVWAGAMGGHGPCGVTGSSGRASWIACEYLPQWASSKCEAMDTTMFHAALSESMR